MEEQYKATTKYVRVSPQKARLTADIIRGMSVPEARLQLLHTQSKASRHLVRTLNSAVANAEMLAEARPEEMFIQEIRVDEGPIHKRSRPCSKGRSHPYKRRTSHFTVVVGMLKRSQ